MDKYKKLITEIQNLRHELSVVIPQEIHSAVELGDIAENTEYLDVLEKQKLLTIRLSNLLSRASEYEAINISSIPHKIIDYGTTFHVLHHETNVSQCFTVVLDLDDDPVECDEITLRSPMGKAFKHKQVGDTVNVSLPNRVATYTITDIATIHDKK